MLGENRGPERASNVADPVKAKLHFQEDQSTLHRDVLLAGRLSIPNAVQRNDIALRKIRHQHRTPEQTQQERTFACFCDATSCSSRPPSTP